MNEKNNKRFNFMAFGAIHSQVVGVYYYNNFILEKLLRVYQLLVKNLFI